MGQMGIEAGQAVGATGAVAVADDQRSGRSAVRVHLIDRLEAAGMVRRRGASVEDHRRWCAWLQDRLAHLTAGELALLADELAGRGQGRDRREWPQDVVILGWADALRPRPPQERPIMRSWLHSVEGPPALAGGYLVELLDHLRRRGLPPGAYDMVKIRERARDAQREADTIRERIRANAASPEQRAWLEQRVRAEAYCRDIVLAGVAHRAALAGAALNDETGGDA